MILLVMLLILIQPMTVSASTQVEKIETENLCLRATQMMESKYNIKKHLLTTIASIESGRWNEKKQQKNAWPWTINAQGKGYFFESKAEAVKKAKQLKAQGVTSFDVGCMQINMLYHGQEFSSLEDAFDPMRNVEYAAQFLRNLYENNHDWMKAAMSYHSSVPEKANAYRQKIVKAFEVVKKNHKEAELMAREPSPKIREALKIPHKSKTRKMASRSLPVAPKPKSKRQHQKLDVNAWREAKLEEYRVQKLLARKY